ncbi:hypothetical protein PG990_013190 [Apiospora arundinis]
MSARPLSNDLRVPGRLWGGGYKQASKINKSNPTECHRATHKEYDDDDRLHDLRDLELGSNDKPDKKNCRYYAAGLSAHLHSPHSLLPVCGAAQTRGSREEKEVLPCLRCCRFCCCLAQLPANRTIKVIRDSSHNRLAAKWLMQAAVTSMHGSEKQQRCSTRTGGV